MRRCLLTLCATLSFTLLFSGQAQADLTVDMDLGTLAVGSSNNLTGTTLGANLNADFYDDINGNQVGFNADKGEYVYQFTTTADAIFSMTSNTTNSDDLADTDYYLLDSLTTINDGTNNRATGALSVVDENGIFGGTGNVYPAGTYYLSVDTFGSSTTRDEGPFDINFDISVAPEPVDFLTSLTGDTTGAPLWHRMDNADTIPPFVPEDSASGVQFPLPYNVWQFSVDTDGQYSLETIDIGSPDFTDTFIALHEGSFDVNDTTYATAIAADDDAGASLYSRLSIADGDAALDLTAGTEYFVAITGYNDSDFGEYQLDISGPVGATVTAENVTSGGTGGGGGGDFDEDGDVDGDDYISWSFGYGAFTSSAAHFDGDADGDGDVDGDDFLTWQAQYAPSGAASSVAGVPEPSTLILLSLLSLGLAWMRRK